VKVHVPTPLRSYTGPRSPVDARGATLDEVLRDLDRRHPGFRFRIVDEQDGIRRHIKLFVNREMVETVGVPLVEGDEVHVVCALSGG
jgi:molybdopterin synthase sulfur carrier subunit